MMSSLVSRDSEAGSQQSARGSDNTVLLASRTFRPFSPARRLFCLLAAFDFLAALFVWILYAHAYSSKEFKDAIKEEVLNYKFKKSLFDIVLLALWRMVILLLAYALFLSRKWYAVAVTTAITTAFLLVKVVLTQFQSPSDNSSATSTLYYILVLVSLVLSWVQSWVLDVKVIPSEVKAEERSSQEQRRPLLNDERYGRFTPHSLVSERSFYTPQASDSEIESDSEEHEHQLVAARISQQDQEFIQKSKETVEITWELMGLNEGWKTEKVKDGLIVESRVIPSGKKIYRLKGSLDARAEDVFDLIILHPENASKWGGNITYSCVVRQIDQHTDIVYNSTGVAGGGMVASRDFVNLRRWEKRGDVFLSCNVAVEVDEMPPKKEHVRGVNGPGGWAMREAEGNPNRTEYVWVFDVDLKGWLPQSVIDTAMSFMLYSTGQGIKNYVRENLG